MLLYILLLLLHTKCIEGTSESCNCCPDAWIRYGNSCYMFVGTTETWVEASQQCLMRGSALAAIETAEENAFITGYLKVFGDIGANMQTWIGGSDVEIEGIWKWASSGERVTYTNWAPTEPDETGDCMVIWPAGGYNYRWADYPCHSLAKFICEKKITAGSLVG
ncbi:perlucin-like [Haliotis rufescens]|uniref:perlucin-like n=1 Tax=Haliotis rufescens TaxID=6454 RepID=UPI00201E9D42|nr:perlucin-like [Haliotis rufescens]